jgi:hypothetical protein
MRKLGLIGGTAATLVVAGVAMAATPSASPTPTTTPAPATSPAPSTAPATTGSSSSAAATMSAASDASAAIMPFDLRGQATIVPGSNGTATIRFAMRGLDPNQTWSVRVYRGTLGNFAKDSLLVSADRTNLDRLGSGTIHLKLTETQYRLVRDAKAKDGLVIRISDGTREAVVTFAKA